MPYYVPFKPIDVVSQGRLRWNRRKHWLVRSAGDKVTLQAVGKHRLAVVAVGGHPIAATVAHPHAGRTHQASRLMASYRISQRL